MVPFILWSFALWNRESLRILFFRHNYELSSYRHVHNDLLICAVYIHYMYRAGIRSTRNALNCINCPILCKRRSSFRAPLWYSSLLSLIHSPTLLSYMSGSPLLSFFLSSRPVSISHARVHLSLSLSLSLSPFAWLSLLSALQSPSFPRASCSVAIRTATVRGRLRKSYGKNRVYIHICRRYICTYNRVRIITRRWFYSSI